MRYGTKHFFFFQQALIRYLNSLSLIPQYMKMMGVNPISHFFAWFIESAVFLLLTIIILTIILKGGGILPRSDGFVLFLYLCDYGFSILAISFLVSSFFDKTNIAGLSGSLIYVISFFPFIVLIHLEDNLSFSVKSALVCTAFKLVLQYNIIAQLHCEICKKAFKVLINAGLII